MCLGRTTGSAGRTLEDAGSIQEPRRPEKRPPPLSVRRVGVPCSARLSKRARWLPGDGRWNRALGTAPVSRFARRCVSRADRRTRTRSAVRSDLRVRPLWFTTPYFAASLVMSLVAIIVYRRAPRARVRPLPPTHSPSSDPLRHSFLANGITRRLLDRRRVPSG